MSCAKQLTLAIIENKGRYWIGSNWCNNPRISCPRIDLPTGVGYEKCIEICQQAGHAEVDACIAAGEFARGGTLYLIGHTYCCDNCKKVMEQYGIKNVIIGEYPTRWPHGKVKT